MRISDWSSDVCSSDLSYLSAWHTLADLPLVVTVSNAEADAFSSWNTRLITVGASAAGMAVLLALAGLWITASSRAHAPMAEARARVGAALERSPTQFEALLKPTPSGTVLQTREARYLLYNPTGQNWLGQRI